MEYSGRRLDLLDLITFSLLRAPPFCTEINNPYASFDLWCQQGIGLETTRQALDAGHDVRALSRSANAISVSNSSLEKIRGNSLKTEDVEAAVVGVDVVIQTLGVGLGELFQPINLFSDATRIVISAMKKEGIKRLLCVTGFGAGDSRARISCLQRVPFQIFTWSRLWGQNFYKRNSSRRAGLIGRSLGREF